MEQTQVVMAQKMDRELGRIDEKVVRHGNDISQPVLTSTQLSFLPEEPPELELPLSVPEPTARTPWSSLLPHMPVITPLL